MTALKEQLFAEAFSELVARASAEPFVGLGAIGRSPANPFDGDRRPLVEVVEVDGRGRRFADLESWIIAKECALWRVHTGQGRPGPPGEAPAGW
jgi:hypothetical protein